jgi:hypothetical protein
LCFGSSFAIDAWPWFFRAFAFKKGLKFPAARPRLQNLHQIHYYGFMSEATPTFEDALEEASSSRKEERAKSYFEELDRYLHPPYTFEYFSPGTSKSEKHQIDPEYHYVGRNNLRTPILGWIDLAINDAAVPLSDVERAILRQSYDAIRALPVDSDPTKKDLSVLRQAIQDAADVLRAHASQNSRDGERAA